MVVIENFAVKTLHLYCNCTCIVVWKILYARQHLREYSSSSKIESIYIYIYIYVCMYVCMYISKYIIYRWSRIKTGYIHFSNC